MRQYEQRYGYARERQDGPAREHCDRPINPGKIRELRLKARRTQQEVASAAEISVTTLATWERGAVPSDHRPRVATILRLAEELGVGFEELLRPEPSAVAS